MSSVQDVKNNKVVEEDDSDKTTNHIVVTQILSQKCDNYKKVKQIVRFYDDQQAGIIAKERMTKECNDIYTKVFPEKKKGKKKDSGCLNTCCFLPKVCCNSTVFITKILISFLFILVVLALLIFIKNLFGKIFY